MKRRLLSGCVFGIAVALVSVATAATSWKQQPGSGKRIAIGADGSIWALGTNPAVGGYGVWRWNGSAWLPVEGGGVEIAVDPKGNPWVVSDNGTVWKRQGDAWKHDVRCANEALARASRGVPS